MCISVSLAMMSCGNGLNERMRQMAADNIRSSVVYPDSITLLGYSEPDSCYGSRYFDADELDAIYTVMDKVEDKIMQSTKNMEEYDPRDLATNELAERHMQASMALNNIMMLPQTESAVFTGWKLKADYETVSATGARYKAERWFFFDKKGKSLFKTFEIPIP